MWLDALRQMKERRGLTTKEVSEVSGIPEPTLEKLFSGTTKDPKLGTLRQLVHALGFTLDDLESNFVDHKNPPAPTDADTGGISLEESNTLLVALGYIKPGEEISDEDLAFLEHIIGLLDVWFDKR